MSVDFLSVVHCIIAVFLTIVVLVQPGKGGGLVMGGGTSQSLFGASGGGNFFTKVTAVLGILFVLTSITITKMHNSTSKKSIFDAGGTAVSTEVEVKDPGTTQPAANPVSAEGDAGADAKPINPAASPEND